MSMATQRPAPGAVTNAGAVVDLGIQACEAYQRPDLATRLRTAKQRLADPVIHIVVVGEFKQGKSSLVNALVGGTICPVDDDVATAIPTYVRHGPEPTAALIYDEDPPRREPIPIDDVRQWVVERSPLIDPAQRPSGVEVRVPRKLLSTGLVLVDTPGVGGLGSAHAAARLAAAAMADALIFVTDTAQELTHSEVQFLRQARDLCGTAVCALTKTDLYPFWRKIRDLDAGHLKRENVDIPV